MKFVVWKECFGFGQQIGFCLFKIWGGQAAFHRTLDLAHGALVKPDAFGTAFRVDCPNRCRCIFTDSAGGTRFIARTTIYAVFCDIETHGERL